MLVKHVFAAAKLLALAIFLTALAPTLPAQAQDDDLDISVFYDELEQYGRWFTHPRYGYVWSPDVEDDWRPYSHGTWIYTDDHGWYWEAEEPWGWGPFHYGRWILDDDYGWVWIPGTEWGPAWVAWRYSDDDEFVGWAPLPPEAEWYEDRGLAFSATYYDEPRFAPLWIFVEPRYLVLPGIYRHALPRSRIVFALGRTRRHTDYRFVNRRIFNAGFDVRRFERITRRPVVRVRLVTSKSRDSRGFRDNDRRTLHTFRPKLANVKPQRAPRLVDPPRRDFRHRDGDRPVVRPGFTPPDQDKRDSQRDRGIATPSKRDNDDDNRRKGLRGPDDNRRKDFVRVPKNDDDIGGQKDRGDDDRRKGFARPPREPQQFQQPRTGLRTPPGQPPDSNDRNHREQRHLKRPQDSQQSPNRQRVDGNSQSQRQFKEQQAPPAQRGDRDQGDSRRKGKRTDQEGNVPR